MSIANFIELLKESMKQTEPQRLLFLFAKATPMALPYQTQHKSGSITPVMCVDKLPSEIKGFKELVAEADRISSKWDFVFIAGLSGKNGQPPSSKDADPYLTKMSNDLANGGTLSRYAIFDRDENIVVIS